MVVGLVLIAVAAGMFLFFIGLALGYHSGKMDAEQARVSDKDRKDWVD